MMQQTVPATPTSMPPKKLATVGLLNLNLVLEYLGTANTIRQQTYLKHISSVLFMFLFNKNPGTVLNKFITDVIQH
jgi:hypothetical protein